MPVVTRKQCHSDLLQQNLPRGTVDRKLSAATPLAPHCVHRVVPSPCCPAPPLTDGGVSGPFFPNMRTVWKAPSSRADPHQPAQAFPRTMILPLASLLLVSLLATPHLPIPAPSPFVLHRDFSLHLPCAVNLLLYKWRTWTDRTPTHQILRQFSNIIFFKKMITK